jgi:hypothetical protein
VAGGEVAGCICANAAPAVLGHLPNPQRLLTASSLNSNSGPGGRAPAPTRRSSPCGPAHALRPTGPTWS